MLKDVGEDDDVEASKPLKQLFAQVTLDDFDSTLTSSLRSVGMRLYSHDTCTSALLNYERDTSGPTPNVENPSSFRNQSGD